MRYWIMKSEPSAYAIADLARDTRTKWEGVRNYQARNFIRDDMRIGDTVFFYHSSCKDPGIVGIATVCSDPYPDSSVMGNENANNVSQWYACDVCYVRTLAHPITLRAMRADHHLRSLLLLQRGNRLSVIPVEASDGQYLFTYEFSKAPHVH